MDSNEMKKLKFIVKLTQIVWTGKITRLMPFFYQNVKISNIFSS